MITENKAVEVRKGLLADHKAEEPDYSTHKHSHEHEHESHDHDSHEHKAPALKTNRTKAIIFLNIHALLIFGSSAGLKHTLNRKDVKTLDVAMIRTLILIAATGMGAYCFGAKFRIAKQDRNLVILRCFLGTLAYVAFVFGISMVSLLSFNAIFNTIPFWAMIVGWVFLRETLSLFEIMALILSFGGVLCVAFASKNDE